MSEPTKTPQHVAIIMDGNGRWAARRGMPRVAGHKKGVERVREIVRAAPGLGVKTLTLYAFSTENWKRPVIEVASLMRLFRIYIRMEAAELVRNGVQVKFIGERGALAPDIQKMMVGLENRSKDNSLLKMQVALNYGGRDEITRAAACIAAKVASGDIAAESINEAMITAHLDTAGTPDPELVIRTSGEFRTSNFLPWQAAYSEYAFVEECFPDFTAQVFEDVLNGFANRDRRFGGVAAQGKAG